jgi:hypothetical protein
MKKYLLGLAFAFIAGVALAATAGIPPTGLQFTSPVTVGGSFSYNGGTQASAVPANGGTVTCTGGGTPTVTNANVTANSVVLFGLKTVGGTPAQPFMSAVTAGTSFVVTCGGSDTSVYNYIILG